MTPKFRAYNGATNVWYSPREVFVNDGNIFLDDEDFEGLTMNNDVELMQFTGLTDKNGVEIFEGDILNIYDEVVKKVFFTHGAFCIDFPSYGTPLHVYGSNQLEVIGNVYENPELVEVE